MFSFFFCFLTKCTFRTQIKQPKILALLKKITSNDIDLHFKQFENELKNHHQYLNAECEIKKNNKESLNKF